MWNNILFIFFRISIGTKRTLKNEEKYENLSSKVDKLNNTLSRPVRNSYIDVQMDETSSESNEVTDRVYFLENEVRKVHQKLDSRTNSQTEFEGKFFIFLIILKIWQEVTARLSQRFLLVQFTLSSFSASILLSCCILHYLLLHFLNIYQYNLGCPKRG